MTAPTRRNAFLDTSTHEAAGRWDDLLTLQVDLFLQHEADHLATLAAWRNAKRIVDVGCGNGYYLSRLSARHPDKTFVGIDVSAELIAYARQRGRGVSGLRFEQRDFLRDGAPECDAMILRFVLQHLPDLPGVLRQAARSLRPGGRVFIIDPDFAESSCSPPLPLFTGMFTAFEAWRASLGLLRGGHSLGQRMQAFDEWRVASDDLVRVVQRPPFRDSMTAAAFAAWINLCERAGGFAYPFDHARDEVAKWAACGEATSSVALRVTVLEPCGLA